MIGFGVQCLDASATRLVDRAIKGLFFYISCATAAGHVDGQSDANVFRVASGGAEHTHNFIENALARVTLGTEANTLHLACGLHQLEVLVHNAARPVADLGESIVGTVDLEAVNSGEAVKPVAGSPLLALVSCDFISKGTSSVEYASCVGWDVAFDCEDDWGWLLIIVVEL
jgi:hypothetical protein